MTDEGEGAIVSKQMLEVCCKGHADRLEEILKTGDYDIE